MTSASPSFGRHGFDDSPTSTLVAVSSGPSEPSHRPDLARQHRVQRATPPRRPTLLMIMSAVLMVVLAASTAVLGARLATAEQRCEIARVASTAPAVLPVSAPTGTVPTAPATAGAQP